MNDFFVIRFAVCAEKANDKDIGKFGVAIVKLVIWRSDFQSGSRVLKKVL